MPLILVDGEAPVLEQALHAGGSAANTIFGLAKLGIKTGFIGAVGDDNEGRILLHDFQRVSVDTSGIKVKKKAQTGSALCLSDGQGQRSLYVSPGANGLLRWQDVDLEYLNRAQIVHLSSFAQDAQFDVQRQVLSAISTTVKISFAPGALYTEKGWQVLAPLIARTYALFLNQDEMQKLTGKEVGKGAQRCLDEGCRIVIVTLGQGIERGKSVVCYLSDGQQEHFIEAMQSKLPVVDTTGAGDAFAAGFLYGLLQGKELRECGLLGQAMAQFAISKMGARAGLPTPSQLRRAYRR